MISFGDIFNYESTYSDPLISVIDPDVVSLPRNGGLWMSSGWDTLHDSRLTCCHYHITGSLTEIISQNWRKRRKWREMVRLSVNIFTDDAILYRTMPTCSLADFLMMWTST